MNWKQDMEDLSMNNFKIYLTENINLRLQYAMELIDKVNSNFPGGSNPKLVDKKDEIAEFLASQKTFGNKTLDKLVDTYGLSYGLAMRLIKDYKEEIKAQLGGSGPALTQAQRINKHLKTNRIRYK